MSARWAAKTDANHQVLLDTLRRLGWAVVSTHTLSNFVDAVGYRPSHGVQLFEFKHARGTLTASQRQLQVEGWPLVVLRTPDEAIRFTGAR